MDRLVVWSHAAADDFEAIASYLARGSAAYASAFASEVWDASQSLATLSERGRVVRELGQADLREIYIRRYRLIYDKAFVSDIGRGAPAMIAAIRLALVQ